MWKSKGEIYINSGGRFFTWLSIPNLIDCLHFLTPVTNWAPSLLPTECSEDNLGDDDL